MNKPLSARGAIRRTIRGRVISFSQIAASRLCRIFLRLNGGFTLQKNCVVDPNKSYLFVANHQSRIDPFAVFGVLSLDDNLHSAPVRFMTAKGIYYSPLLPLLKAFGCYPTKNYEVTVRESVDLLKRGYNLFIFPEGRRTLRVDSKPRQGVSTIIQAAGSDLKLQLILVHIEWRIKRFGRRHATISITQAPEELLEKDADAIMAAVYDV